MTKQVRASFIAIVALAVMGLASCDHYVCSSGATFGNTTCASGTTTVSGNTGTVFTYMLAEEGASDGMAANELDLGTNSFQEATSFVAPTLPSTIVFDGGTVVVSTAFVYAAFRNGTVYGYTINGATGALTNIPGIPYSASGGSCIAADPGGNFLFVGDSVSGEISAFTINSTTGALTAVAGSPFASGIAAAQMATDGQGKYLYVTAGTNGTQVAAFAITPTTGVLTAITNSPFALSVSQLVGENTGKYMLGIDGVSSAIRVFSITSGAISDVAGSPFATVSAPVNIVMAPSGNFVYALDGLSLPMEGYSLSTSSGILTAVQDSPFTGINLDLAQFDQSGSFLFGVSEGPVAAEFAPYAVNSSSGVITTTTYEPAGFPCGSFAVTDLSDAP
jgi:6-phosphogluconolactonase